MHYCNRWTVVARPGLEPMTFRWPCEHYHWATEPPVISPTPFHLNPTRLHTSPGSSNSSTNFLWGNPRISYILPRRTYRLNHLSIVGIFMVGAICNRWTIVARTKGLSLTVRTLPLSFRATRSSHQQSSPEPYSVTLYILCSPVLWFDVLTRYYHQHHVILELKIV